MASLIVAAEFLAEGLAQGEAALIIAIPAHRAALLKHLAARAFDLARLEVSRRLVLLDASSTLSLFMRDGEPQQARQEAVVSVIRQTFADARHDRFRVYDEMPQLLRAAGAAEAAARLESLWNEVTTHRSGDPIASPLRSVL
jgi:KaiC/GvpD/RAD55 family RecA-like ATPase